MLVAIMLLATLGGILASEVRLERMRSVLLRRNVFGTLRVNQGAVGEGVMARALVHGHVTHGKQLWLNGVTHREPTTYYTEQSGIGLAIRWHPRRQAHDSLRLGTVGLGIGTLAAYTQQHDAFHAFEINPAVIEIASDARLFTYLADCPARERVIHLGDAYRVLARNAPLQLDVLAIDAFTSGAIPTHLLTLEALDQYLRHLRDAGSLIAFHVNSAHLDLEPVLHRLAQVRGLAIRKITHFENVPLTGLPTIWILLGQSGSAIDHPQVVRRSTPVKPAARHVWTMDRMPLLDAVIWH
jgi:spermidine synthase